MFSAPFLSTLLHRVKAVVRRVARPVAERAGRMRAPSPDREISPVLREVAQDWLRTRLRALSALMRRIEAGERLDTRIRKPLAAKRAFSPAVREPITPEARLPRGFGWMCSFGPDVRGNGAAFAAWLDEPAMQARVLAAPERMAQLIAPILNATGQPRPKWFPNLPKNAVSHLAGGSLCRVDPGTPLKLEDLGSGFSEEVPADTETREPGCLEGKPTHGFAQSSSPSACEPRPRWRAASFNPTPARPSHLQDETNCQSWFATVGRMSRAGLDNHRQSSFAKMRHLGFGKRVTISLRYQKR
jgi:hypothetical protein